MPFDTLLGNEQLKTNLAQSLSKGHVSHFYLISGPLGSGKHTLARLLAAAILCRDAARPCLHCSACRKIMDGTHPDFITVDEPDKATVSIKLIRDSMAELYIRPNESDYKIYLFPRAQDIRIEGQNALLKILEEPPKHGVFLLLTDNPDKLLPTVRSRCTELKLHGLSRDLMQRQLQAEFPKCSSEDIAAAALRSGGFLGQAKLLLSGGMAVPEQTEKFTAAFVGRDSLLLMQTLVPMEKWKRDPLIDMLQSWLELMEQAIVCRSGIRTVSPLARQIAAGRTGPELMAAMEALKKSVDYAQSNVSPAAICGYLEWALR